MDSNEILIVDDDEINRGILNILFSPSYRVDEAENGRIGLDKLMADPGRYCAVLLDVMMPEMDGLEVLRHLEQAELVEKIPIFLITAEASDAVMREAYRIGVMDVISKPVVPYVVKRRINSVVGPKAAWQCGGAAAVRAVTAGAEDHQAEPGNDSGPVYGN